MTCVDELANVIYNNTELRIRTPSGDFQFSAKQKQQIVEALHFAVKPADDSADAALARENHWRKLEGRNPVPPQPTPDAMREALEPFATFGRGEGITPNGLIRDRICDWFGPSDFDAAHVAFNSSAPVPSPDGAGVPLADHDEIGREVLGQPWDIQSAIVTIAAHCVVLKDEYPSGLASDIAGCISQDCMKLALALSPSGAGAAEPVAWQKRPKFGDVRIWTTFKNPSPPDEDFDFWREQDYELRPLYAAPPVRGDREAMRAVDAFDLGFAWARSLDDQRVEDSRAVGRTLLSDLFAGLKIDLDGFDSFKGGDEGIVDAKRRIKAAILSLPYAPVSEPKP